MTTNSQSVISAFYALLGRSAFSESCLVWRVPLSSSEQKALRQFGEAVRRERTALGMTQERLAELTDLHLRTIQKIEAGDINVLITTAKRIHKALGCTWDRLML
jgi:DNA-binding XRE family transcriptional regulator